MSGEMLPDELVASLLMRATALTLQSHGFSTAHPLALRLVVETVQNRLLSLLHRVASMANTQRRTVPSSIDLNYALILEGISTAALEDEILRWPEPSRPPAPVLSTESPHPALLSSPLDHNHALSLPTINTPAVIPPAFPRFPPTHTYVFTPSFPPRAVDPETIRRKAVEETALIQSSLARLMASEHPRPSPPPSATSPAKDPARQRAQVWWDTWNQIDPSGVEIWPVDRVPQRSVPWSL